MADKQDESLYPIAVLIDELKNEDIQVSGLPTMPDIANMFLHLANSFA